MNRFLFIPITLLLSYCTSKYYVVRHAERIDNSSNSALSSDGLKRAQDLKDTLTSRKIDLIYVSTFLRTQQTAQ
ncbi:MAG: phosphoglycerate mutase family protein, partial [Ginsengibacter sp.]